jgi:hypothetical protein
MLLMLKLQVEKPPFTGKPASHGELASSFKFCCRSGCPDPENRVCQFLQRPLKMCTISRALKAAIGQNFPSDSVTVTVTVTAARGSRTARLRLSVLCTHFPHHDRMTVVAVRSGLGFALTGTFSRRTTWGDQAPTSRHRPGQIGDLKRQREK